MIPLSIIAATMIGLICCVFFLPSLVLENVKKEIHYEIIEQKIEVNLLPNQEFTNTINKFLIDNSIIEIPCSNKDLPKFYDENLSQPYIIVDYLDFGNSKEQIKSSIYFNEKSIDELFNQEKMNNAYILKEVHY